MPKITMVFGFLLCGLTVAILILSGGIGSVSIFIPTFIGIPLILLGLFAILKPELRKHLMHAAATVGLLGALAALGPGIPQVLKIMQGEEVPLLRVSMVWSMILICVTYVLVCVQSFVTARKARLAQGHGPTAEAKGQ